MSGSPTAVGERPVWMWVADIRHHVVKGGSGSSRVFHFLGKTINRSLAGNQPRRVSRSILLVPVDTGESLAREFRRSHSPPQSFRGGPG